MTEAPPYIYNVEFAIDSIAVYDFPEAKKSDKVDTIIQFQMQPGVLLQISEDELIDAYNCGEKKIMHAMFSMSEEQLHADKKGRIVAKVKCEDELMQVGSYEIRQLNECFEKLKARYDEQQRKNDMHAVKMTTPITSAIQELAPFKNSANKSCGSVVYILRLTCFGPRITRELSFGNDFEGFMTDCNSNRSKAKEEKCLSKCEAKKDCDEYIAQINGNSLIVRISKNNPYMVTRVLDSCSDNDKLTIRGCDQQIDFKFPNNFTCCQCKKTFATCKCNGDSHLTDYQKQTSCEGTSFKNNTVLPVIRGNLKYPGRFEDQSISFNVRGSGRDSQDATGKYRVQADKTRNACLQVDKDNLERELDGKFKIPKGIKMCRLSCENDTDVFVLKLGKKGKSRDGKEHEIELEMRTPRGPNVGPKRMETREVQVVEEEFEDAKGKMEEEVKKECGGSKKKPKDAKGKGAAAAKGAKKATPVKRK
jgi:hypothetical protein